MKRYLRVCSSLALIDVCTSTVYLKLRKDRELPSTEFEKDRAPRRAAVPDARINFQSQHGGGGGSSRDISITLGSDDPKKLEDVGNRLLAEMAKVTEIRSPRVEGHLQRPEIVLPPRFALPAPLGGPPQDLRQPSPPATLGHHAPNNPKYP